MAQGQGCLTREGSVDRCTWHLDETHLLVTTEGGHSVALALGAVRRLSGDGHSIRLDAGTATLELGRLGAGGATLLEELWRTWPEARARALRLQADSGSEVFTGTLARGSGPMPCRFSLCPGVLLAAPEGDDLAPLFLPLLEAIRFDPETYAWRLAGEGGESWTLARLAGRTERCGELLSARRATLAAETESALAATLPTLSGGARALLAPAWQLGRLRTLAELESMAPGLGKALHGVVTAGPRAAEAALLLAVPELRLAMARPGWGGEAVAAPAEANEGETLTAPPPEAAAPEGAYPLWGLARLGSDWVLEALSEGNHATYVFSGGDEVSGLVSRLFCAPQVPLAALYLAESALTPEEAVPAQELPFLCDLRAHFRKRVIHNGFEAWRRALGFS